jgi:hypothetical protein
MKSEYKKYNNIQFNVFSNIRIYTIKYISGDQFSVSWKDLGSKTQSVTYSFLRIKQNLENNWIKKTQKIKNISLYLL